MVLTKDEVTSTLHQLREVDGLSGEAFIKGVQLALANLEAGRSGSIGDDLSRLWIILVRRKSKPETREMYHRFTRLFEGWSEGLFNLDSDLWMVSYHTALNVSLKLLQHLLQIQAEFRKPDVVREEVSYIQQLLSNYSTSAWAPFDEAIRNKCLQEIIPSAVERSERHEDIQKWLEFDEIIRLAKHYLVKRCLPSS